MDQLSEQITAISKATLDLPAVEILGLLLILTFCLLLKHVRAGIIIAYLFAYKWGWTLLVGNDTTYMLWYMIFGMAIGVFTVIGMLKAPKSTH